MFFAKKVFWISKIEPTFEAKTAVITPVRYICWICRVNEKDRSFSMIREWVSKELLTYTIPFYPPFPQHFPPSQYQYMIHASPHQQEKGKLQERRQSPCGRLWQLSAPETLESKSVKNPIIPLISVMLWTASARYNLIFISH